jgi:hypothetical protein
MKNERISPSRCFEVRYEIIRGVYWVVLLSPALNLRHQAMSTAEYGSTVYCIQYSRTAEPHPLEKNVQSRRAARSPQRTYMYRTGRPAAGRGAPQDDAADRIG